MKILAGISFWGNTVLYGSLEDQLKHTLDIGVGDLVELVTVPHLFVDISFLISTSLGFSENVMKWFWNAPVLRSA